MARSTAEYYRQNPKAKAKKNAYQKKYNRSELQIKKRVELNKINRKKGTYGNGDGKDVSHKKDGSTVMENQSKNRARNRGRK
jgi:hypothetical protein